MLTSLKVSSLACKCVFYRTELNAKWGLNWIEFWRSWGDREKNEKNRVDEKNGIIFLVIKVTYRVMTFKMSEIANYFYFLLITTKN